MKILQFKILLAVIALAMYIQYNAVIASSDDKNHPEKTTIKNPLLEETMSEESSNYAGGFKDKKSLFLFKTNCSIARLTSNIQEGLFASFMGMSQLKDYSSYLSLLCTAYENYKIELSRKIKEVYSQIGLIDIYQTKILLELEQMNECIEYMLSSIKLTTNNIPELSKYIVEVMNTIKDLENTMVPYSKSTPNITKNGLGSEKKEAEEANNKELEMCKIKNTLQLKLMKLDTSIAILKHKKTIILERNNFETKIKELISQSYKINLLAINNKEDPAQKKRLTEIIEKFRLHERIYWNKVSVEHTGYIKETSELMKSSAQDKYSLKELIDKIQPHISVIQKQVEKDKEFLLTILKNTPIVGTCFAFKKCKE
ncbi:hypothetical protein NEPAR04_0203 [Nematocida parisii]|nr:hypothetical protein NEPAR03_0197 [Nematocida parisii]KAI5125709.1 hypothetical protein NEPAR08_0147 [Nematocida parisii]KAI5140258.1 hypothetical protein NEPAR04_0203 [Nematocida parisii]